MISKKLIAALSVLAMTAMVLPVAIADDTIEQFEAQLLQIDKKYGMPIQPELTDEQWNALDKEKEPYYKQLDELDLQYEDVWSQIDKIDAKYGFVTTYPELTDQQWQSYDAERNAVWEKMDAYYDELDTAYDKQYLAIVSEYGITEPFTYDDNPAFFDGMWDEIGDSIDLVYQLGMPDLTADEKSQISQRLVESNPQISKYYEKHGYVFPSLSAEQFTSLAQKMYQLEELH